MSRKQLEVFRKIVHLPERGVALSVVDIPHADPDAPTGVFLHGGGGNLTQWHYQMDHFRPKMRVVAYDFRGHGCSEGPDSNYDIGEFVDDLVAILPLLNVPEKFFLLSHSFGGAVAAHYAAQYSHRLHGLALIATAGQITLQPTLYGVFKLPNFALRPVQWLIRNNISTPVPILKKMIPKLMAWRGWDLYEKIEAPSLVVSGEYDMLTRTKAMKRMADLLPDGWFERISFSGHLPHLERPTRVNDVLDAFMFGGQRASWRPRQSPPA